MNRKYNKKTTRKKQLIKRVAFFFIFCAIFLTLTFFKKDNIVKHSQLNGNVKSHIISLTDIYSISKIKELKAFSILSDPVLNDETIKELFYSTEIIDSVKQRIMGISYK